MKHPHSLRLRLTAGTLIVLVLALLICCTLMVNASRKVMEASVISLTAREESTLMDRVSDQLKKMDPVTNANALQYVFHVLSSQTKSGSESVMNCLSGFGGFFTGWFRF